MSYKKFTLLTVVMKGKISYIDQIHFFLKIFLWAFYAFIWKGQCRVDRKALGEERGERDRQRTTKGHVQQRQLLK